MITISELNESIKKDEKNYKLPHYKKETINKILKKLKKEGI